MNLQTTFFLTYYRKDVNQTTLNHTILNTLRIFMAFVQILLNMNLSLNQTQDSQSLALLDYFFLLKLVFVLKWLSLYWEILIK